MSVKQVIVIRKDLNMRKGKMVAQGAHASMAFLSNRAREGLLHTKPSMTAFVLSGAQLEWIEGRFTKICVGVNSLEELEAITAHAKDEGLECHVITDAGLTEFDGPTVTAVGIGPDEAVMIDVVTGHLELL